MSQKILKGVAGVKSILWIVAILSEVYGVMGPLKKNVQKYVHLSCY